MARHSSITRSTLYTIPSKVQLVSSSMRTRSSLPAALSSSRRCLIPERHSAVHRVVVERVAVQIDDLRARQHHAVVMGFVAVAVHQHDVAGRTMACTTILLQVEVPLVEKKVCLAPKARPPFPGLS